MTEQQILDKIGEGFPFIVTFPKYSDLFSNSITDIKYKMENFKYIPLNEKAEKLLETDGHWVTAVLCDKVNYLRLYTHYLKNGVNISIETAAAKEL